MNTEVSDTVEILAKSEEEMKAFGARLGAQLRGGEVIELIGDVGAGKTTLVKGIAAGLGVDEDVQSPTFTISRLYTTASVDATGSALVLAHYDFYRLSDPGIMAEELRETVHNDSTITVIEWAGVVEGVLPDDKLSITITSPTETSRRLVLEARGVRSRQAMEGVA